MKPITRSIFVDVREWRDRTYGNTYFSARVYVDGSEVARLPFQYGHGEQFETAAAKTLQELGYLPADEHLYALGRWIREMFSGEVDYYTTRRWVTKREAEDWGKPAES